MLGLLVTISLALTGWAFKCIVEHGKQLVRVETKVEAHDKEDERMFQSEREQTERQVDGVRSEQNLQYGQLKADLAEVKGSVTAIHRRMDATRQSWNEENERDK